MEPTSGKRNEKTYPVWLAFGTGLIKPGTVLTDASREITARWVRMGPLLPWYPRLHSQSGGGDAGAPSQRMDVLALQKENGGYKPIDLCVSACVWKCRAKGLLPVKRFTRTS